MSNIVIKVENLSKAYQLGQIGTGSISRDLERWYARIRGKEDPFLTIGESNDQHSKSESSVVWSLKNINVEIEQGDAVGIVGRNGAGKSTLLKILSKVTAPTTGKISGKGRIASLLEVGTGFHPDLSGRENIFLNGAILGMRKREIQRKLDEIVDFAGIERYLDTPVKRYSSGMYVRLAFAVAAHLESEILIVDEVLAVGDAEFQKKCLGKMGEVSKSQGRTVLFVSHNMNAVQKLCEKAIYLDNGQIKLSGKTGHVVEQYLHIAKNHQSIFHFETPSDETAQAYVYQLQVEDEYGNLISEIPVGKSWQVRILFKVNIPLSEFIVAIGITNASEIGVRTCWSNKMVVEPGHYHAVFKENKLYYSPGTYYLTLGLSNSEKSIFYAENAASFFISDIADPELDKSIIKINNVGLILNPMPIEITPIE